MNSDNSFPTNAIENLLSERNEAGHWRGKLSSSALSTATALIALRLSDGSAGDTPVTEGSAKDRKSGGDASPLASNPPPSQAGHLCDSGLKWLSENQNEDGGWGDTSRSFSNISTTLLCWSALGVADEANRFSTTTEKAERWIESHVGSLEPKAITKKVVARYGKDKTFSVPILMACCLGGRLGDKGWKLIPSLPFELAAFPRTWFAALRLPVVSYALPALIAIGQLLHQQKRPPAWLPTAIARQFTKDRTLAILQDIQPSTGGYLEATPLTSFVTMALAGAGHTPSDATAAGEVMRAAIQFLENSVRDDGSWPIDTDLATWTTTLSVNAFHESGHSLSNDEGQVILDWLLGQQYREIHPFTVAAPGAWAWTDLPGGVPDADDTSGALLAIHRLRHLETAKVDAAAERGITWLLDLQNRDGGMPTFCRGWGALPFDRSCNDITAHALAAWATWESTMPGPLRARIQVATEKAVHYLTRTQNSDGSWLPLWFGNQHLDGENNPTYGTARVVHGLTVVSRQDYPEVEELIAEGRSWLLANQNDDGSWSGGKGHPPSIEETALSITALAGAPEADGPVQYGHEWLKEATGSGTRFKESPIGFYFAKLWYFERLYPRIFTVAATGN
ncbi:MAG: prenyltransferase/squalene oxidase repeat-containing protein [Verrucomicrobiota bacterium]